MPDDRALTVTEAMIAAKRALETVSVHVIGEVSEFNDKPGYKAAYFTVADDGSCMPCMMWRDAYEGSGVRLRCGALVELWGSFSAYAPKGRMQFMVKRMAMAGEGVLRIQVAELARKLESEGLMAASRKRSLPSFPTRIAVVTSPRGKAIHDVIRTLCRRYPVAELLVAGISVEGADAAPEIVRGLAVAAEAHPDVILLVRGGGSYEDLMPFNTEIVARAVVDSPVPVVTGIGHEPDNSIADMVADVCASTPTAAAEASTPSTVELRQRLDKTSKLLGRALLHRIQTAEHAVGLLLRRSVFTDRTVLVAPAAQAIDLAASALHRAIPERLRRDADRVEYARRNMRGLSERILAKPKESIAILAARLQDLSPLGILSRGYAATFAEDGVTVIQSVDQVERGDRVRVRVFDGEIGCTVETKSREK